MPTQVILGERVGRQGRLRFGCSGTLFDETGERILLTRRTDNGLWCLPGGGMDPGESAAEACQREILEETGLRVQVVRLIGIYSSPDWLVQYPDGNRVQIVAVNFEVVALDGQMTSSNEVSQFGYFTVAELDGLQLMENHRQRIIDAFARQSEAFIR